MRFSVEQILAAINDPNYKNGLPNQPVGYPCVAQADVTATVVCPYLFLQPPNTVLLEVIGYTANVTSGGGGQNYIFMLTTLRALVAASLAAPVSNAIQLMQSANPQGKARTVRLTGEIAGGVPPTPAQYIERGFFSTPQNTPITKFPIPIVLHGEAAIQQVAGVMGSGPDVTMYPSIFCREWPLDTDNY